MGLVDSAEVAPVPATRTSTASPAVVEAEVEPWLTAAFTDGCGLLSLERRPLSTLVAIERLRLEIPGVLSPAELAGDAGRFRNRRCRLLGVTVVTDLPRLAAELERPERRAALEAAGIFELRAGVANGALGLTGRAAFGDRQATFTAQVDLLPTTSRSVQLAIGELRLYGFLPVPARLVAGALLTGALGPDGATADGWSVERDLLDPALYELFAGQGWRLPETTSARLAAVEIGGQRIALSWTDLGAADEPPRSALDGDGNGDDGPPGAVAAADGLLARGDFVGALAGYRQALATSPDDALAQSRILELLVAGPGWLGEADEMACVVLGRLPQHAQALLARAVSAGERGDPLTAAAHYEQLLALADQRGEEEDAVAAGLAAAEHWLQARQADRAGTLAERVLAARPGHPQALELLDLARAGFPATPPAEAAALADPLAAMLETGDRLDDLAALLGRRASVETTPAVRADLLYRQAKVLERAGRFADAAAVYRDLAALDGAGVAELLTLAERLRAEGRTDRDAGQDAEVLQILGDLLVSNGDLAGADRVFEARIAVASDDETRALLATERARIRLLGPDGAAQALALLHDIPLEVAPEEALILRADLGERRGSLGDAVPALNELAVRARRASDNLSAERIEERVAELLSQAESSIPDPERSSGLFAATIPTGGAPPSPAAHPFLAALPATSVEDLEQTLISNPTDPTAAEELAGIYANIPDARDRAEALSGLLRRAVGLSPDRRKALYANLGASAEASGDLDRAEQAYWRAATIEAEPALRANFLVSHARVLLARGELQTAIGELEEALARVPDHAGALALLAELTFRIQDWDRARQLYRALEAAAGSADVISRELLMYRRALLARAAGADAEAETYLREVAILNPRHVEAREALAETALGRGDLGAAALRLEEVLRLLPLDALDRLLDVRQRLGAIYVQLQDWGAARYYVELVLAQDPARLEALELLVEVYLRLTLHKEAARACARLSRLYLEPHRRAEILYRQSEILRAHVGDGAGALDALLKSCDLDPQFTPTLVRLVDHYWRAGDFEALTEIAGDLQRSNFPHDPQDVDLGIRLAIGTALGAGAAAPNAPPASWDAPRVARALAEAAAFLGARPPGDLTRALAPFVKPAARQNGEKNGEKIGEKDGAGAGLFRALKDLVLDDPSCMNMGAARALACLADDGGQLTAARALYSLLVFVDPADGAAGRLAELGATPAADPRSLRIDGETNHSFCAGPLRAALRALAAPLLGWRAAATDDAAPPPESTAAEGGLPAARDAELRRLGELLEAPPFVVNFAASFAASAPTGDAPPAPEGPPRSAMIAVRPTRPARLVVAAAAETLAERQWTFLAAEALDDLRTGMACVRDLSAEELRAFLAGVEAALTETDGPAHPIGRAVRAWLGQPEPTAELPAGAERARLLNDVRASRSTPENWATFQRACQYTSQRIGLLACGHPLDALKALARNDALLSSDDAGGAGPRRGLLRTSAVRELLRYMLSGEYQLALAEGPRPLSGR